MKTRRDALAPGVLVRLVRPVDFESGFKLGVGTICEVYSVHDSSLGLTWRESPTLSHSFAVGRSAVERA